MSRKHTVHRTANLDDMLSEARRLLEMDTAVLHASRTPEEIKTWGSKVDERHFEIARLRRERDRKAMRRNGILVPLDATWNWLKSHPILTIALALSPVMITGGPTAIAGFFMIVMTLSILWFLARSLVKHWTRKDALAARGPIITGRTYTLPGGVLAVKGTLTPEQLDELSKRFRNARDNRTTLVLPAGAKYLPAPGAKQPGGVVYGGPLPLSESVSAMHPDATEEPEPLHPELPAWMRQTWNKAIADYRTRVYVEGTKYRDLKEQFSELYRSVLDRDSMIDWTRRQVEPSHSHEPVDVRELQRIERGLEAISPEGARYGELLFRAQRGEDIRKYATEDGEVVMLGQKAVASPEMPRDFAPILDRDFELTTNCRYHHVADHVIVEQEVTDGHVLRCCTVCEPATYWLERA
jgi:hypothetical protein